MQLRMCWYFMVEIVQPFLYARDNIVSMMCTLATPFRPLQTLARPC